MIKVETAKKFTETAKIKKAEKERIGENTKEIENKKFIFRTNELLKEISEIIKEKASAGENILEWYFPTDLSYTHLMEKRTRIADKVKKSGFKVTLVESPYSPYLVIKW